MSKAVKKAADSGPLRFEWPCEGEPVAGILRVRVGVGHHYADDSAAAFRAPAVVSRCLLDLLVTEAAVLDGFLKAVLGKAGLLGQEFNRREATDDRKIPARPGR
jgi:hypothetical protein